MQISQVFEKDYPNNIFIDFTYSSTSYYKTKIEMEEKIWHISFYCSEFESEYKHAEKIKFFNFFKDNAEYYIAESEKGDQIGWMCIGKVEWKNTTRLWDLYIDKIHIRKGIGSELIKLAEKRTKELNCRALEIETQSSNINAIRFYLASGYNLSGFDSICYTNDDIGKNNVRLEFSKKFK